MLNVRYVQKPNRELCCLPVTFQLWTISIIWGLQSTTQRLPDSTSISIQTILEEVIYIVHPVVYK